MKKTVALCTLLMAVPFLQACTDSDAEALVDIAIIGWSWSDGGWHHDNDHHERDHHVDVHSGPAHGGHRLQMMPEVPRASMQIELEAAGPAEQMSSDFGIKLSSAQAILEFTQGDAEAQERAAALGLSNSDLAALAQLQMPSAEAISKIAKALDEDPSRIEQITRSYVSSVKAQLADVNSEYWEACIQSGSWSTPSNSFCKSTSWEGCSPETGATTCKVQ